MAITLTKTAYIINNSLCTTGSEILIDCTTAHPQEYIWIVMAESEFGDGCGGYLSIGEKITELQTLGHAAETWIKLLHIVGGGVDVYISETTAEEWLAACKCIPECICVLTYESIGLLPAEGDNLHLYVVTSGPETGIYIWNGSAYVKVSDDPTCCPIFEETLAEFPVTGVENQIYVVTGVTDRGSYIWDGAAYVSIGGSGGYTVSSNEVAIVATGGLALGATDLITSRLVDATAGNIAITVTPTFVGQIVNLKRIDATANTITIAMNAGNIDGAASVLLTGQYTNLQIQKSTINSFIL